MLPNVLLALAIVSAFLGLYNLSWKSRRVTILSRFGYVEDVQQYRKPILGWSFCGLAVVFTVAFVMCR